MASSSKSQRLYENENLESAKDMIGFSGLVGEDEDPRYMDFIRMIFQSHNSSINKFHLCCTPKVDISSVKDWISVVVERNVQDIFITLKNMPLQLPESLFICKTLVSLKLYFNLQIDVPASIHFPCLKLFHVKVISPTNHLTENLFCSSPMLEELVIFVRGESGNSIYNISSSCLKKLFVSITANTINFNSVVNVDAPILESMKVVHIGCPRYNLKNSSSLVKADCNICVGLLRNEALNYNVRENVAMLLNSVSSVKDIHLGDRFPLLLLNKFDPSNISTWPAFPNLKHLKLNMGVAINASILTDLLVLAPNLISLVFAEGHFSIKPKLLDCSEKMSCSQSCLKKIEVLKFSGLESEFNLIKYFLMNAQVLEKMTVTFSNATPINEPLKVEEWKLEIDMMPRCSKCCKLVFI